MRRSWVCVVAAASAAIILAGCAPDGDVAGGRIDFQRIIATAKRKVYPALVFIKPIQETFGSGERQRAEVLGSGVIVSADGYVVSNHHVCEKAIEVNCVLGDREQVPATVVGLDPETDLALLKLKLDPNRGPLPTADFADSDKVEAGQFVMALGSPFGFTRSISLGIISNTRRYIGFTTQYRYNLWLQTDAAINPGNSGGPLVDTDGKVIGINTLGGGWAENIGFAIPSNVVSDVLGRLKSAAAETPAEQWPVKVRRAYTGLQLQALNDFKTNTFSDSRRGVLIQSVDKGSPAAAAGVKDGDILLAVNGRAMDGLYVEDLPMLRVLLADLDSEKPSQFLVARRDATSGGKEPPEAYAGKLGGRKVLGVDLTPVARGKFEGEDFDCRRWNMTVKEITKFSNPRLYFLQPTGGVFVRGVRSRGNAADAGLRTNDILLKIDKWDVRTIADVRKAYEALVGDSKRVDKKVLITIKRDGFLDWKPLSWEKDYLQED
ncbi:MAG: trypsin-like peptidase domain-containing protein [Phycisphaerae bacterium]